MVEVKQIGDGDPLAFEVRVAEGGGESRHRVTLSTSTLNSLGRGVAGIEFVRAAFAFLLEREPKESILSRFDVSVIGRYFPEFDEAIGDYLEVGQ